MANIIQVICKGGVVVLCDRDRLTKASKYVEALLDGKWKDANKTTIEIREISSSFLIETLEERDNDPREIVEDPSDFLMVSEKLEPEEFLTAPPLPPQQLGSDRWWVRIQESKRFTLASTAQMKPLSNNPSDVYTQFMIHIDRKACTDEAMWDKIAVTLKLPFLEPYTLTFQQIWILANILAPQDIKLYRDRIDLPIFPDLVYFQICVLYGAYITSTYGSQISALASNLSSDIRNQLCNTVQVVPFTTPLVFGQIKYISGEGLTVQHIRGVNVDDQNFGLEYVDNDRLQLKNPFGKNVRTLVIHPKEPDGENPMAFLQGICRRGTTLSGLNVAPEKLSVYKKRLGHAPGFECDLNVETWALKTSKLKYENGKLEHFDLNY